MRHEVHAVTEPEIKRLPPRPRRYWRARILDLVAEMSAESAVRGIERLREGGMSAAETVRTAEMVQGLAVRALLAVELRRLPGSDTTAIIDLLERSNARHHVLTLAQIEQARRILDDSVTACESTLDPKPNGAKAWEYSLIRFILGVGGDFSDPASSSGSHKYGSKPTRFSASPSSHISTLPPPSPAPTAEVAVRRTNKPLPVQPRLGVWRLPVRIINRLQVADRILREVAKGRGADPQVVTAAKLADMINPFRELLRAQKTPEEYELVLTPPKRIAQPLEMTADEARWHFGRHDPKRVVRFLLSGIPMTKHRLRDEEFETRMLPHRAGMQCARIELGGCMLYHPKSKIEVVVRPTRARTGVGGPRGWLTNRRLAEEVMLRELERRAGVKKPWSPGKTHGGFTVKEKA